MKSRLLPACLLIAAISGAPRAMSQTSAPDAAAQVEGLVHQLEAADSGQRKEIADKIRALDFKYVPALDKAANRAGLDPENRAFIESVADSLRPAFGRNRMEEW